ncbi:hypothetical protein [Streptomyces telluris]|uniref:Uncharacterized protein n=1 Tax=Streptomyces telluris TaxID=2720021 RepID=A0A9X2RSF3_9ACTN|nr:hypothetical protein [Streptomyces telluris]MCQ8774571.1 hypothetical protein [Streptomyces telluris]NJP81088.1 hypothetical protein [Streptomyces telluris]
MASGWWAGPLRGLAEEGGTLAHLSGMGGPEAVQVLVDVAVVAQGRLDSVGLC